MLVILDKIDAADGPKKSRRVSGKLVMYAKHVVVSGQRMKAKGE